MVSENGSRRSHVLISLLRRTVNGRTVRTLTKASTLDSASGLFKYPQTPSRIQMSVWPAGIAGAPQGTLDWAGGMIDWGSSEYKTKVINAGLNACPSPELIRLSLSPVSQGFYAANIQWINVQCYTGSDLTLSASSNSSRLARRDLWERADPFSSYVWGCE